MSLMRWGGFIVAVAAFAFVFRRFCRGQLKRADFLFASLICLALIVVSLFPNSVNHLRDMLLLAPTQFSRLIAILIVSSVLLWLLLFSTRFHLSDYAFQFDKLIRRLGVVEFERIYPTVKRLPPVVVVIPAYNEADNIGVVLEEMPRAVCGRELAAIVIDDGSQDATLAVARKAGAMAVSTPMNRGGGAALRMGFDIARAYGAEIVVTMDADGQHLPSEIERLVAPIVAGEADFVVGSRILGRRERDSVVRYVGIRFFSAVIRLLTGVPITDCSNGFRAFRVSELARLRMRQDQFHASEIIIEAAKKGVRIREAPITVKRRLSGQSKKGRNWTYGFNFAKTILKSWWR